VSGTMKDEHSEYEAGVVRVRDILVREGPRS
jgi:hypothetical protein